MRAIVARMAIGAALVLAAASAHAGDDWQNIAFVSNTLDVSSSRLCLGAPSTLRGSDIGCPTYAPYVTSAGNVGIGTTFPYGPLHIASQGSNSAKAVLEAVTGNAGIDFYRGGVFRYFMGLGGTPANNWSLYNAGIRSLTPVHSQGCSPLRRAQHHHSRAAR